MLSKRQFLLKFIYCFNLYANVLFGFTIVCIAIAIYFQNVFSLIFVAGGLISCFFGIRITTLFTIKYKYYQVIHKKINKNGYSIDHFENGVMDPCFRLLTKQILFDVNKSEDYKIIINGFGNTKRTVAYKSKKIIDDLKRKENV
jgi:K+ transporter